LVSLGGAARNVAKVKFRQPLAEVRVQTESDAVRRAVERFGDQIREELNVKAVSLHYAGHGGLVPDLLMASVKLNKKTAAAKLGPKLKEAEGYLATESGAILAEKFQRGSVAIVGVLLDPSDVMVEYRAADPGWAGVADKDTQLVIDARITDELAREGTARDVIRLVQDHRKNSGLNIEDRIALYLHTDSDKLRAAIEAHRDHIAAETLTVQWLAEPPAETVEVKIEGQALRIGLRRIG
jgi:isoleucyl-tRNA synthetase